MIKPADKWYIIIVMPYIRLTIITAGTATRPPIKSHDYQSLNGGDDSPEVESNKQPFVSVS